MTERQRLWLSLEICNDFGQKYSCESTSLLQGLPDGSNFGHPEKNQYQFKYKGENQCLNLSQIERGSVRGIFCTEQKSLMWFMWAKVLEFYMKIH